jgi:membrane-bound metal-dependent hydrolase YbcI (DUF457 family)
VDFLTHGVAGAFIAWARPRRWMVSKATPVTVAAALLPDLDVFGGFDTTSSLAHRGFTHSLFGVAVLAPLVAVVPWWLTKRKESYGIYVALVGLGMLSHLVLDVPTEVGSRVFWPFYRKTVFVDWLSGIDFTFFTLALFVLLAAWTFSKPEVALRRGILSSALLLVFCWWLFARWPLFGRRLSMSLYTDEPFHTVYPLVLGTMLLLLFIAFWRAGWSFRQNPATFGRFGLAVFAIYLLACGAAHWAALRQINEFTRAHGIRVLGRAASRLDPSSFIGPLRWTGLVRAPEGVYEAEVSLLGPESPKFRLYSYPAENQFLAKAKSVPEVKSYLSEARFPVSCYEPQGNQRLAEFYDPWWGVGVERVVLNEHLEILATRWVPVRKYASRASNSATAPAQSNVGPDSQRAHTPCFLQTSMKVLPPNPTAMGKAAH